MRALSTEFDLFGVTRVPAGPGCAMRRVRTCPKGRSPADRGEIQNSGNELDKCFKTGEIAFLNSANCASFARNSAQIVRRKEQKTAKPAQNELEFASGKARPTE